MNHTIPAMLNIAIFLGAGIILKRTRTISDREIEGIKKIVLLLAIPAVLFLSFSSIEIDMQVLPLVIFAFTINLIMLGIGTLAYRTTGRRDPAWVLMATTMNFGLVGLPLYESFFGLGNIRHYSVFGMGGELFSWLVFYYVFRPLLGRVPKAASRIPVPGDNSPLPRSPRKSSPIMWGMLAGCLFSILGIDVASSESMVVKGVYTALLALSKTASPLILIYIGFSISFAPRNLLVSLKHIALRLAAICTVSYGIKWLVIDRIVARSPYSDAAFFLFITLPAAFFVPIVASDVLSEDERTTLSNTVVLHSLVTMVLFSVYVLAM